MMTKTAMTTWFPLCITTVILLLNEVAAESVEEGAPSVHLPNGPIQGAVKYAENNTTPVYTFFGIPYAAPPVGDLRFRSPKPAESWDGVRDATKFGAPCPQPMIATKAGFRPYPTNYEDEDASEDCLFLNIYTPSLEREAKLPVMVWIHGGSFAMGMGNTHDGTAYAAMEGVVVVTINYRLGVLGFLSTRDDASPGNYGLLDQVAALRWLRTHVSKFGGNPNQVTILGESAGGVSVSLHILSPLSRGLFQAAVAQSASALVPGNLEGKHRERAQLFAELIPRCKNTPEASTEILVECLRLVDVEVLMKVQLHMFRMMNYFWPCIDGYFLTDLPLRLYQSGNFNPVPYLTGATSLEGFYLATSRNPDFLTKNFVHRTCLASIGDWVKFFYPKKHEEIKELVLLHYFNGVRESDVETLRIRYAEVIGDGLLTAPIHWAAKLHSVQAPVYFYVFDHKPTFSIHPDWLLQPTHVEELPFMWGDVFIPDGPLAGVIKYTDEERSLSRRMMNYWANFARNGDPNNMESPGWPSLLAKQEFYLKIDAERDKAQLNYRPNIMQLWQDKIPEVLGQLPKKSPESHVTDEL